MKQLALNKHHCLSVCYARSGAGGRCRILNCLWLELVRIGGEGPAFNRFCDSCCQSSGWPIVNTVSKLNPSVLKQYVQCTLYSICFIYVFVSLYVVHDFVYNICCIMIDIVIYLSYPFLAPSPQVPSPIHPLEASRSRPAGRYQWSLSMRRF